MSVGVIIPDALQAPQMVQGFQASARPVSIADFREFVLRGDSYTSAALWAPEDYAVMQAAKQRCPSTWTVTVSGASLAGLDMADCAVRCLLMWNIERGA